MDLLRIGHLRDRNYAQISGGERQLVLIARALAQSPRFSHHGRANAAP